MELLRRALLVGCFLPGLWLMRLAPLDPILTLAPIDFAAQQKREAAAIPDEQKTEAQRRTATLPLSVYIEEVLQYNVYPATLRRGGQSAEGGRRPGDQWQGDRSLLAALRHG